LANLDVKISGYKPITDVPKINYPITEKEEEDSHKIIWMMLIPPNLLLFSTASRKP
jgi:hypothetical protein